MAYFRVEPFGEARRDILHAQLMALVANTNAQLMALVANVNRNPNRPSYKAPSYKADEFLPKWWAEHEVCEPSRVEFRRKWDAFVSKILDKKHGK